MGRAGVFAFAVLSAVCAPASSPRAVTTSLRATLGELEPAGAVCDGRRATCARLDRGTRSPKMRAQAQGKGGDEAELDFLYLGPTEEVAPLASGRMRRQLGLKLRARDSCNVLYVMWRIEPDAELVVSRKSNPGKRRHAECGNAGYVNLRPRRQGALPRLEEGARHLLRARLVGRVLRVWVDGSLVWEGEVGPLDFDGPVGVRSDNVRFAFSLRTP